MSGKLLSLPAQLKKAGIAGSGKFFLGFEPWLRLFVDGKMLYNERLTNNYSVRPDYLAAIYRIEVEVGFDVVHSATIYITGREAAKLVQEQMPRGGIVEIKMGFLDVAVSEHPANKERTIFKGEVLQAKGPKGYPPEVMVECSGASWRMSKDRSEAPEEANDAPGYIASRFADPEIKLQANFTETPPEQTVEAVATQGSESLLDFVDDFTIKQGLHWVDNGGGKIFFIYPRNRFNFFDQPPINWSLRQGGSLTKPEEAAPLTNWDVYVKFVDTPGIITGSWQAPRQGKERKIEDFAELTVEGGDPERTYNMGIIEGRTKEDAQKKFEALASDLLWQSITGEFGVGVPLPILPMDTITATNGPPGAEDVYDIAMQVLHTQFIWDEGKMLVQGSVRGVIE